MQNIILIFLIINALTGCTRKDSLLGIVSIPEAGWPIEKDLKFQFHIGKPNQQGDLRYQVQYDPEFSWENIWLSYYLVDPRGDTVYHSTDNLFLFEPGSGKPYGKGCRERLFVDAYFLKGIRFKDTGNYRLSVRQQMRQTRLNGIQSLGVRLDESVKN
jgi:gliding motility-associated lipoprotein GldH